MEKSTKGKNNKLTIKPNISGLGEKCCKVPSTRKIYLHIIVYWYIVIYLIVNN